jgi:hypothetical protein
MKGYIYCEKFIRKVIIPYVDISGPGRKSGNVTKSSYRMVSKEKKYFIMTPMKTTE